MSDPVWCAAGVALMAWLGMNLAYRAGFRRGRKAGRLEGRVEMFGEVIPDLEAFSRDAECVVRLAEANRETRPANVTTCASAGWRDALDRDTGIITSTWSEGPDGAPIRA